MPHHEGDQAADAVADQHGRRINKLGQEVKQLVPPQLRGVVQQRLIRAAEAQQVNGVDLRARACICCGMSAKSLCSIGM